MKNKIAPSEQTQQEAFKIANATQKPGQTKEQTKLIAQGIEKGIALYKKQQKEKGRQADKARKKAQKTKSANSSSHNLPPPTDPKKAILDRILLAHLHQVPHHAVLHHDKVYTIICKNFMPVR